MDEKELLQKIEMLEEQNSVLLEWQQNVNQLLSKMMQMIGAQEQKIKENEDGDLMLQYNILELQGIVNSLPFELADPELSLPIVKPHILSAKETLRLLVEEHKSISRFGDCEFELIAGRQRWGYQAADPELSRRLREVVCSDEENLLVGINPSFYQSQLFKTGDSALGIRAYMTPEIRREHAELLRSDKTYGDALLFRNVDSDEGFAELKKLWEKRDCLFVEGRHTGLGAGNDLFDNAASIERIICPAENGFARYPEILEKTKKHADGKLIISVLGPTASVLAYDLSREGHQAIDLGQVDLVYEAYLKNLTSMDEMVLPDKYCTSDVVGNRREIQDIADPAYKSQIVEIIE